LVLLVGSALVGSLVRPVRVVVPGVLGQDSGGVAFAVDQDVVGALAADGAYEPLGITVRPGSGGGVLVIVMFSLRNTVSKLVVNLASLFRMRKRNELIRSPRCMARLRAA
jgi:hypothetical protein